MRTFATPAFERCLKDMPAERRREIIAIIRRVAECYGYPHKHIGLAQVPQLAKAAKKVSEEGRFFAQAAHEGNRVPKAM